MPWSAALTLLVGCAFLPSDATPPAEPVPAFDAAEGPAAEADARIDARIRRRVGGGALDDAAWPAILARARALAGDATPAPAGRPDPLDAEALRLLGALAESLGAADEPTRTVAVAFVVEHRLGVAAFRDPSADADAAARAAVLDVVTRGRTLPADDARGWLTDVVRAEDPARARAAALELLRLGPPRAGDRGAATATALRSAAERAEGTSDAVLYRYVAARVGPGGVAGGG
jgi:hypothetical protein